MQLPVGKDLTCHNSKNIYSYYAVFQDAFVSGTGKGNRFFP